ncbi:hypothetical protein C8R43DRAFT_954661 [Mycena crocata]|nr:hypothetical protein C8R43DRAFT_954661 [Mycena crocata]
MPLSDTDLTWFFQKLERPVDNISVLPDVATEKIPIANTPAEYTDRWNVKSFQFSFSNRHEPPRTGCIFYKETNLGSLPTAVAAAEIVVGSHTQAYMRCWLPHVVNNNGENRFFKRLLKHGLLPEQQFPSLDSIWFSQRAKTSEGVSISIGSTCKWVATATCATKDATTESADPRLMEITIPTIAILQWLDPMADDFPKANLISPCVELIYTHPHRNHIRESDEDSEITYVEAKQLLK